MIDQKVLEGPPRKVIVLPDNVIQRSNESWIVP